ncbi:MAG: AAA family ATPase [Desulfobacterales bacterium]|nr:AAA family ATPase [Desulfobacterales bacterium]
MSEYQEAHTVSGAEGLASGLRGLRRGRRAHRGGPRAGPTAWCCWTRWRRPTRTCWSSSTRSSTRARMEDGEGREIDFKNTLIILTSNAGHRHHHEGLRRRGDHARTSQALAEHGQARAGRSTSSPRSWAGSRWCPTIPSRTRSCGSSPS